MWSPTMTLSQFTHTAMVKEKKVFVLVTVSKNALHATRSSRISSQLIMMTLQASDDRKVWHMSYPYQLVIYNSGLSIFIFTWHPILHSVPLSAYTAYMATLIPLPPANTHTCTNSSLLGWFKLMVKPASMRENRSGRFTLHLAAITLCLSQHPLVLWWWRHDERKPLFHLSPISLSVASSFFSSHKACL